MAVDLYLVDRFEGGSTMIERIDLPRALRWLWALAAAALPAAAFGQCEEAKLLPPSVEEGDLFGIAIAASGDTALFGAHGVFDRAGAVYVFNRQGRAWIEAGRILASDLRANALFGHDVGIDGDLMVVGAPWDSDNGTLAGAAYAYRFDGREWTDEFKLMASDGGAFEFFANRVAVSGDFVLIGESHDRDQGPEAGAAYLYLTEGSTWTEYAKLLPSDGGEFDWFGFAVDIEGPVAVIGARQDAPNGKESGSAYVYRFDGREWVEEQKLLPSDGAAGDRFGNAVVVRGDTIVVGAPGRSENGGASGAAYVFEFDGQRWTQTQKLLAFDGGRRHWFGVTTELQGDTLLVGAFLENVAGGVYLFKHDGQRWVQTGKLVSTDISDGDQLGFGLALAGDHALLGAHADDDAGAESGAAYVFDVSRGPCGGREKLRARCTGDGQDNRIIAKIKKGLGQRTPTLRIDEDPQTDSVVWLDCDGAGSTKLRGIASGTHRVELVGCRPSQRVTCP
ncbi:MAG: hypothetical protein C4547_05790 [Phycisphaerales bacterium]|nr:MAG: hypothetical protein C4547_05790 [Phycisphaerales bacterium]